MRFTNLMSFLARSLGRQQLQNVRPNRPSGLSARRVRLGLEPLADRTVLSTYFVQSPADFSVVPLTGTLRDAIYKTNDGAHTGFDRIAFTFSGATIRLDSPLPAISRSVTIEGNNNVVDGSFAGYAEGLHV